MLKKIFSITFALVLMMGLSLVMAAPAAVGAEPGYDSTLVLENKDANWSVINDSTQGTLEYNASGPTFDFSFNATGLDFSTNYSLIYYADKPDRFVDWGGNNPGALITTFTTDGSGDIAPTNGSVELDMDLPCPPDANMDEYDYSSPPDNYTHAHGAKIWLVPSSCYVVDSENKVTSWEPTRFLFETDLITYDDTEVLGNQVQTTTNVLQDKIQVSVWPGSLDFGSVYPGHCSGTRSLNVRNDGSVAVNLSAEARSDFYETCLKIDGSSVGTWAVTGLGESAIWNPVLQVCVPSDYAAGFQTGTLIIWAKKA